MRDFFDEYRGEIVDVLTRAAKTFVQSLTATLTVPALFGGNTTAVRAALVAAFAAGFSVIWNALVIWSNER